LINIKAFQQEKSSFNSAFFPLKLLQNSLSIRHIFGLARNTRILTPIIRGALPMKPLHMLTALSLVLALSACQTPGSGSGNADGSGSGYTRTNTDVTPGTQEDLAANVGDRVFFGYDSAELDDESQSTLERQASWLKEFKDAAVTVEGHADERGTREYNIALGERRAHAAKKYLVSLGIAANRVSTISYGKERPAVVGSDDTSYSQNRRAVTVVTNQ
jgi:peptidoglycan-associated lipoprotein